MKQGWQLLLAAFVMTACGGNLPNVYDEQDDTAYIRLPLAEIDGEFLKSTDFNRDHKQDDVFAFGYIERAKLETLPAPLRHDVIELDERLSRIEFDTKTLEYDETQLKSLADLKEGYHDYDALTEELHALAASFPHITHLTSAGQSVQNRDLWVMKVSDNATIDEDEPKLLYIANMHGDEVVGRELMIYLIRHLLNGYGSDERITHLIDHAQIYIMPSMNPDGFERGRRANARNSDLNRDFPDFLSDPRDDSTGRQIETRHVMRLHDEHHFVQAINFHGGAVCFNLPWDTKSNRSIEQRFGEDPLLATLGRAYADTNTHMSANGGFDRGVTYGYEWYRVTGGMQDWANYYRRSMHATVELSFSKWPASNTLSTHWQRNKDALLDYLESGLHGAHLKVVDASGTLIDNVSVNVASTARRSVRYDRGVIHKPTLPGAQTVTLSAPGFLSRTIQITPSRFNGEFQTIVLERSAQLAHDKSL